MIRMSMDYAFFTDDETYKETEHIEKVSAQVSMTILVMTETQCGSLWAYTVQSKGASEPWIAEQIVEDFETIGLTQDRLIIKADQKVSITALQRSVASLRAEYGTAIEQSRVGDSSSNGRVERAMQELKGFTRTLRSAVSAMIQQLVRLADPLVPWMVRHAAHIIDVC